MKLTFSSKEDFLNHLEKWLTIETKATDIEFVETGKAAS